MGLIERPLEFTAEPAESAENDIAGGLNEITEKIIGGAITVHRALGPGLLESAYEACLAFELAELGLTVVRQQPLPVVYRGVRLDCGYRVDVVVNNEIIVEVKSVARLEPIHNAQLLSYVKLSERRVGLLINFNVKLLRQGLRRLVHNFPQSTVRVAS